jgi:hypothetical protein
MQAVAVGLAVDGDGANAHLAAGGDDPQGDLTTICDQNLTKHVNSACFHPCPERLDEEEFEAVFNIPSGAKAPPMLWHLWRD